MKRPYYCPKVFYKHFAYLSLFLLFSISCSDDLFEPADLPVTTKGAVGDLGSVGSVTRSDSTLNGDIVLGAAIPNPYTLDTVRKAFTKVFPNGYGQMGPSNLVTTDLYIRFLPANDQEYLLLENNGIVMTTLPMDREIAQGGSSYFDPSLNPETNEYTWQYTIIPITQPIPNVRYEILKRLCNIEARTDGQQGPGGLNNSVLASIEAKAYQMAGQTPPPPVSEGTGSEGPPKWRPSGTILVWDDLVDGFVGAKGANVVCKAFGFITRGVTDSYGNYSTNSKRGRSWNVSYEIQWGRDSWKVQDDKETREAIYVGPTSNSSWSVEIKGGKQETFATVTRALHRMYNEFNEHVSRPTGSSKLKVVCFNAVPVGHSGANFSGSSFLGFDTEATIKLWNKTSETTYMTTPKVLYAMFHELGHAVHRRRMVTSRSVWNNTENIIIESWACLIGNYITELEYNELESRYGRSLTLVEQTYISLPGQVTYGPISPKPSPNVTFSSYYNRQDWPYHNMTAQPSIISKDKINYSPVMIDLVDSNNQGLDYRIWGISEKWPTTMYKKFPNDGVSGYTLAQIEGAVSNTKNLEEFRGKVKAIRNNSAEKVKIDTLINKVKYYWDKYKN